MRYFVFFLIIFSFHLQGAELNLPALKSPVMDLANMMSEAEREDLSQLAYEIHTHNGPQITVLTVKDMQGYPIEEYSIRVAEKWQLGSKEKDNGLLVIIAKSERQMRIEVGNGIEGEITDYDTSQYTRRIFPEYFKRGDFHGAIRLFMEDVAGKFNISLTGEKNRYLRKAPQRTPHGLGKLAILFFIIVVFIGGLFRKKSIKGLFTGLSFSGIAFFLGFPLFVLIIAFVFGLFFGFLGLGHALGHIPGGHGRGGFGGGGFGGGGFGGGGGWSGGGGGFSGGGSSGSW